MCLKGCTADLKFSQNAPRKKRVQKLENTAYHNSFLEIHHAHSVAMPLQLKTIPLGTSVAQWVGICLQCRGREFDPWSRRIPHAVGQRGPHASTREKPASCNEEPVLHTEVSCELQLRLDTVKKSNKYIF